MRGRSGCEAEASSSRLLRDVPRPFAISACSGKGATVARILPTFPAELSERARRARRLSGPGKRKL